ncbi:hypothetical protein BJ170DRAFT_595302 [Xylariales sp. AK1849]|nr:hypothetical protein BJ170DRAFT_595302 [Xylariales sp. AK1849]
MALTEENGISVAEICFYIPSLFIAIWLCISHGFGRNAGWLYLIFFSLVRIIGSALSLATISDPKNVSLYIGAAVLANIGLSSLILVELGLLGRALASIRKATSTILNESQMRLIQLVLLVGPGILGAIGGSQAGTDDSKTGKYTSQTLSKVSMGLMIAGYVLTVLAALKVARQISYAEPGEKRIMLAVALSLPFVLVRLTYSAESIYGNNSNFNQRTGNINIRLGMSVIMEMFAVAIVESVGFTLRKVPKGQTSAGLAEQNKIQGDYEMTPRSYEVIHGQDTAYRGHAVI